MFENTPRTDKIKGYPLSGYECLKIGGHCYERQELAFMVYPHQNIRVCKHCGKTQRGIPQDPIRWED